MVERIKIVGHRRPRQRDVEKEYDVLLRTLRILRGNRGICPKGVYRFTSFEEANQWMIKAIAGITAETQR
jgi:hypothetical protein